MASGLIQLVAVGVQDEKLTRDPVITFFQSVYDPYVNFAIESIENTWNGVADFGRKVQVDLSRSGDLVTKCTIEVDLPELRDWTGTGQAGVAWAPNLAHALVQEVCVNIGGVDIDRHYGMWWDAWTNLTLPAEKRVGYNRMIGQQNLEYVAAPPNSSQVNPALEQSVAVGGTVQTNQVTGVSLRTTGNQTCKNSVAATVITQVADPPVLEETEVDPTVVNYHPAQKLFIPLRFWFNCDWGLALPLIALQFHQVRIQVHFRRFEECIVLCPGASDADTPPTVASNEPSNLSPTTGSVRPLSMVGSVLWVDYVYLDNDARQHMAQNPHEYLIKQLQYNQGEGIGTDKPRIRLNFNHPCTELVMFFQENAAVVRGESENGDLNDTASIYGGNQWNWYAQFTPNSPTDATNVGAQPVNTLKLQMNGQDRFAARTGDYFNLVQPYYHHSNIPVESEDHLDTRYRGLLVYSFALDPEEHQPQGTANASRLDTMTIIASLANIGSGNEGVAHVFAVNYNFFRVAGGMGGVAFAS